LGIVRQLTIAVNLRTVLIKVAKKSGVKTYYPIRDSICFFLIIFVFALC